MEITYVRDALEKARKNAPNGQDCWSAREIMPVLGYETWRGFADAVDRAKQACTESGHIASHHFVESGKMAEIGSGARRQIEDIILSRYACYLVTMNGDPSKPEIATAQAYFAVQTRLQEIQQELPEIERRKLLRERVKQANKGLSSAAKEAGVRSAMFGIFHDEGYKGLYGGLGVTAIKKKKRIDDKEDLLDHAGRVELAANEFRITQAEERIRNQRIQGESNAIQAHRKAGIEVREAIKRIGGTMPENLPAEESLKRLTGKRKQKLSSGSAPRTGV